MTRNLLLVVLFVGIALIFSVCGGETTEKSPESAKETKAEQKSDEGVTVAKEILETFDKAVAEAAELAKTKPAAAELKPKLEALFKKYEDTMKEINVKYLALKDKDIQQFGAANGYLGENRGKHVFKKDEVLTEYVNHYYSNGDQDIVQLLSKDIIKMLDVAVKR
jgi:predicted ribosome quality control (RQC) complex YloA/Tae2 family protein